MLRLHTEVHQGILFMHLIGELDYNSLDILSTEINELLYKHGFQYFVFDFHNTNQLDQEAFTTFQNKLVEIFLTCGKVVMCGLKKQSEKWIGKYKQLFFVNHEVEAFQYLTL